MRKALYGFIAGVLLSAAFVAGTSYAQSGQVNFLGAIAGTTKTANCGTPSTPSLCTVGDGVWIWQNSTTGWFLPMPPATAPVGVQKVQGVAPGLTGNVQLTCTISLPAMTANFSAGASTSATIPASATITVPCTANGS